MAIGALSYCRGVLSWRSVVLVVARIGRSGVSSVAGRRRIAEAIEAGDVARVIERHSGAAHPPVAQRLWAAGGAGHPMTESGTIGAERPHHEDQRQR
jgi:hypothetical protein